jgi:hypothetical protein
MNNENPRPSTFPKRKKKWDKSEVLLGTYWELDKCIGDSLGT